MILAPTFSVIIAYFWRSFITYKKQQDAENKAIRQGLQSLLRYRIINTYNESVAKGYIPIHDYEAINACYAAYEELGDNGVIDDLMREIRDLPHKKINKEN